jgi:hypothetical protein
VLSVSWQHSSQHHCPMPNHQESTFKRMKLGRSYYIWVTPHSLVGFITDANNLTFVPHLLYVSVLSMIHDEGKVLIAWTYISQHIINTSLFFKIWQKFCLSIKTSKYARALQREKKNYQTFMKNDKKNGIYIPFLFSIKFKSYILFYDD